MLYILIEANTICAIFFNENFENIDLENNLAGGRAKMNKRNKHIEPINFCRPGTMSRCGAGTIWKEQKMCKFSRQSTQGNKCMYYIESIEDHCDCVVAQIERRNGTNDI